MGKYLQYGCGFVGPDEWLNYDASLMIILRKIPVLGKIIQMKRNLYVQKNIKYGNIIKGFPEHNGSCDAVYCSHVLEHLTHDEFMIAIKNTYLLLKENGVFRLVTPDLKRMCENYLRNESNPEASIEFIGGTNMGLKKQRSIIDRIRRVFSNSFHLWLWDYNSVKKILIMTGFKNIRRCEYHDSEIKEFKMVENPNRFIEALTIEAKK